MPERDLWQEVLFQQIRDARLEPSCWPVPARYQEEAAEAREYLTTPSKDLETVCSLVGLDMEALVDRMQRKVASIPAVQIPQEAMGRPASPKRVPKAINPKAARTRGRLIEHAGRCLTIRDWSVLTGISVGAIHGRLCTGWTVAEALTIAPSQSQRLRGSLRANTITHDGETLTYRQWAERTGLIWSTIRDRHKKGWPVEDVLRVARGKGASNQVVYYGPFSYIQRDRIGANDDSERP